MDGGGRLLRSVNATPLLAMRGALPAVVRTPPPRRIRNSATRLPRFAGTAAMAALFAGIALAGAAQGGHLQSMRAGFGDMHHTVGRMLGFGVQRVTISGHVELSEAEIVAASGVDGRQSLPFIDVNAIRERIMALPLVERASVRKLYPNDLVIDVVEREAFAVWQKDGDLNVIASDGSPTEKMRDPRFVDLPLVVGEGANRRAKEFVALIDAVPELKARIRAGSLIGERRWNLKMTNGLLVKLPEEAPDDALRRLARAQREGKLLDRDILSVDLREPDRIIVRLTAEPAEIRLDAARKKLGKWAGNDA